MSKVASVPYANGKSYDFYDNKLVIGTTEIPYDEIRGYGYLLTHSKQSINFIPVSNSTSFTIYLDLGGNKPFTFGRHSSGALHIKGGKQRTVDLIYAETIKCIEALIAPTVFTNCLKDLDEYKSLQVGSLTITHTDLFTKTLFSTKTIPINEYAGTLIKSGVVYVYRRNQRKPFYSCSLTKINAPLMQPILDTIYNHQLAK